MRIWIAIAAVFLAAPATGQRNPTPFYEDTKQCSGFS